ALVQSLERIVGAGHVVTLPELEIDGLRPAALVRPGSCEEVAECLGSCNEKRAAVVPAGNMTWLEAGNPLSGADVIISMERMHRVLDYSAPDLTATLQAGASVREFNALIAAETQWLPLDPPGVEAASIGGIVACASSGPLRFGFGTPRDYVIGLKLAHPDGKESKCGGKVVKNVAGYDLNKLYIGSFGTLAVITAVTVKLRPSPERMTTVALLADNDESLFDLASRILRSGLRPVSLTIINDRVAETAGVAGRQVSLVRFAGSESEVAYQVGATSEMTGSGSPSQRADVESQRAWRIISDIDRLGTVALKISVLPSNVREVYAACVSIQNSSVAADAGAGIVRVAFDSDDIESIDRLATLRAVAEKAGGTTFLERAPLAVRKKVDSWSDPGAAGTLMKTIKRQFDPESILNPGKLAGGI
ncbi:MAG: FAD-binding oxidoreductase, partial [Blastocatellia bacterium]